MRKDQAMANLTVTLPEALKEEFLREFGDEDRSALIAEFIRDAIEQRRQRRNRRAAVEQILAIREAAPIVSGDELRELRGMGRH